MTDNAFRCWLPDRGVDGRRSLRQRVALDGLFLPCRQHVVEGIVTNALSEK